MSEFLKNLARGHFIHIPIYLCKTLNIALNRLNSIPNDHKFDADSENGPGMSRKTIFRRESLAKMF